MRESVIYQGILQEGIEKGRQEGELSLMLKILTNRWGQLPGDLVANLNSLSIEQIEELSRVVFDLKDRQALADWLEHRAKRP